MRRGVRRRLTESKIELIVAAQVADDIIDALSRAARTGKPSDDGVIVASEVNEAVKVGGRQGVEFAHS